MKPIPWRLVSGCREKLLQEVVNCLKQGEGDLATLEYVSTESQLYTLGVKIPGFFSRDFSPSFLGHNALSIPSTMEEIYGRMSSSRRKHLRADAKKLTTHVLGGARIVRYRHEDGPLKHFSRMPKKSRRKLINAD